MRHRTGGELVADVLRAAGVRTVFGVLSVHNLPIVEAIAAESSMRFVPARGEAGAGNMADGYARASGELGVVVTSTGGGAANVAGALLEAHDGASPVLHVTGQVDSQLIDSGRTMLHGNPGQQALLGSIGKGVLRAARTEEIPGVLGAGIRLARSGRPGPVSIEIPIDQQFRAVPARPVAVPSSPAMEPDRTSLGRAVGALRSARRPLVWAGGGAARAAGDDATLITRLAEHLGAGVITTSAGRGAIPEDHPLCIGNFSVEPCVVELLARSDFVLALGTSFRGNETRSWSLPMPSLLVQVDRAPERLGCGFPLAVGITGEIDLTVEALLDRLGPAAPSSDWLLEVHAARTLARDRWSATLGDHRAILDGLRAAVPADAVVVRDVTVPATAWGSRLLETRSPRTALHSAGLALGQGLAMGIGAAIARPGGRVVVLVGDGGLAMATGELATSVQEGLDLVVVVFNDAGYGILRNLQDAHLDGRRFATDLHAPDFVALARAYGCAASRITHGCDVGPAVAAAVARGGVTLLELDLDAIGPMAVPFVGAAKLVPDR